MAKKRGTSEVYNVVTLTVTANAITPNCDQSNLFDVSNAAALTINNPTGTPSDGQKMQFRIKNSGASPWTPAPGTIYRNGTDIVAPSAIAAGKTNRLMYEYHAGDTKWDLISEIKGF